MTSTDHEEKPQPGVLDELTAQLINRHGAVLGSRAIAKELGYPSSAAFEQALVRNKLPVRVFKLPNRRGHFCLTIDVARFLSKARDQSIPSH